MNPRRQQKLEDELRSLSPADLHELEYEAYERDVPAWAYLDTFLGRSLRLRQAVGHLWRAIRETFLG